MRIHLLGTGGAANECRYQACLLLDAGPAGSLLFDTGNGMDLVRRLTGIDCDPRAIRHIFVSHRHIDHAGGLEPLLLWHATEAKDRDLPAIHIYGDGRTLAALQKMYEAISTVVPQLYGEQLHWVALTHNQPVQVTDELRFTPFLVDHLPEDGGAMGCIVDAGGKRVAYSGDSRPCQALAEACSGADLLFHEAGGLDGNAAWIHTIGHSTAADAGRTAAVAGVQRLVLTHFPSESLVDSMLAEARTAFPGRTELAQELGQLDL